MIGRKLFVATGLMLCLAIGFPGDASSAALKKVGQIKVKSGYIDSHYAVSPDGRKLAYVHVGDGRKPTFLNIVDIRGRHRRLARVNITKVTVSPVRLLFTPDSKRVVLVFEVGGRSLVVPKRAVFFELGGKQAGKVSNFHELSFRKGGKGWEAVAYLRSLKGQLVTHTITLYNLKTLRRGKVARLRAKRDGEVAKPKMKIAFWTADFARVVCKVAGAYNRAADARDNDREKTYDPFTKKFVTDKEITQHGAWTKVRKIRAANERVPYLMRITGSQKKFDFEMIDNKHQRVKLKNTAPSLQRFDFKSFVQQSSWAAGKVLFSFTVDPQWPTLFGRKRNVPEVFHLFRLDVSTRQSTPLGTIPSPKQVMAWRLGGTKLAVMRLHKYWKLGHKVIEIYAVPAAK